MYNNKHIYLLFIALLLALSGGCSSTAKQAESTLLGPDLYDEQQTLDPFEPYNRYMFSFNQDLDKKILHPIARSYRKYVPNLIRIGIYNFFANAAEARNIVNSLLQGKPQQTADSFSRMFINTMFGFGVFDIATQAGLERRIEDIGQTLAVWGVGPGPYIIIPVLGPSSGRDVLGLYSYFSYTDPLGYLSDTTARISLLVVDLVDTRSRYLQAVSLFDFAALDPYVFAREAYYQAREDMIFDGKPPEPDAYSN